MGRLVRKEEDLTEKDLSDPGIIAAHAKRAGLPIRLQDVADTDKVIHVTSTWRDRLTTIERLDFEELENVFYAAGLRGASFQAVCRYFGIRRAGTEGVDLAAVTVTRIDELKRSFEAGQAELQLRLRSVQIEEALVKKNPLMLIWVSKNFAGLSDDGQVDFIANEDGTGAVGGLFTSIKANRADDGTTVGPVIETEIEPTDGQDER